MTIKMLWDTVEIYNWEKHTAQYQYIVRRRHEVIAKQNVTLHVFSNHSLYEAIFQAPADVTACTYIYPIVIRFFSAKQKVIALCWRCESAQCLLNWSSI